MSVSEVNKNISQNLAYLRESRGVSRNDLSRRAALLDVAFSETAIRRVEDGSRPLRADEAAAISSIFNIEIETLLHESLNTQTPANRALYDLQAAIDSLVSAQSAMEQASGTMVQAHGKAVTALETYVSVAGLVATEEELEATAVEQEKRLPSLPDGTRYFGNKATHDVIYALKQASNSVRHAAGVIFGEQDG